MLRLSRPSLLLLVLSLAVIFVSHQTLAKSDDKIQDEFFQAVRNDSPGDIKEYVEKHGADIDAIGPGGQTPLMHAVLQGRPKSVQTLLDLGADVTIAEKDGYTPLHGAGFQGRFRVLKLLLDHNPKLHPVQRMDPLAYHADGYAPIHRACWGREKRHAETIRVFLEQGKVPYDYPSKDGKTPIQMTKNPHAIEILEEWASKEGEDVEL